MVVAFHKPEPFCASRASLAALVLSEARGCLVNPGISRGSLSLNESETTGSVVTVCFMKSRFS